MAKLKAALISFFVLAHLLSCSLAGNDFKQETATGPNGSVLAIALQGDGRIVIGGTFDSCNGTGRTRVARLNVDGSLDASFDPGVGPNDEVCSVVVQGDGKILIGGYFTTCGGLDRRHVARLNADGGVDLSFSPGAVADNSVYSVAVQSDGKVLICGSFDYLNNGFPCLGIARLNVNGSLDTSFNPGTPGPSNAVNSIAVQSDSEILVGGQFTVINNSTNRGRIARFGPSGTLDSGFTTVTGADSIVSCIALQSDGRILVGGHFLSYDGTSRQFIARLNSNGTLDNAFDVGTGASSNVNAIALQSDGKVIIGGDFASFNGTPCGHVARLNTDGSLDSGFAAGAGTNGPVFAIAVQSDGVVLIGGSFGSWDGGNTRNLAWLSK